MHITVLKENADDADAQRTKATALTLLSRFADALRALPPDAAPLVRAYCHYRSGQVCLKIEFVSLFFFSVCGVLLVVKPA